jgi:hypothetical protein
LFTYFSSVFFVWGFVEDTVYHEKVQNVNELHDNCQSCRAFYQ